MSLGMQLLILLTAFCAIGLLRGQKIWREGQTLYQRWQRFRAYESQLTAGTLPLPTSYHPRYDPVQLQNKDTDIAASPDDASRVASSYPEAWTGRHERSAGTFRPDGIPSFDVSAPVGLTTYPGTQAVQSPPRDLRVSIAEMDRNHPEYTHLFPLGWSMTPTGPQLTSYAFVNDVNHILVTGQTNAGKDALINMWLYTLAYRAGPQDIQFAIVDGKNGLSVRGWYEKAHVWQFARHAEDIEPTLQAITTERLRREQLLWDTHCETWEEYDGQEHIPLLVVYIAELEVLKSILGASTLESWLTKELSTARASGIRFIVGTQQVSGMKMSWRSQCSLMVAGYQSHHSADEPNTGLPTKAFEELSTRDQRDVYGNLQPVTYALPPSKLPGPPEGAGMFTLVQGRNTLTFRAPYIDKQQRTWWLRSLPDRQEPRPAVAPPMVSSTEQEPISHTPWEEHHGSPVVEPAPQQIHTPSLGYDLGAVQQLINTPSVQLQELSQYPLFVRACELEYEKTNSYRGVAITFWGKSSGSREKIIKEIIVAQRGEENDRENPAQQLASAA